MADESFKSKDAANYDHVTGPYDKYTVRVTPPLAHLAIEFAEPGESDRVLDIGTGTGVVALALADRLAEGGHVDGIDLSDGMLETARAKAAAAGCEDKVSFGKGDAENLDAADASYDAVISLFSLLHFPHPDRALAECHRVLKPGGRLVVAVGSGPRWLTPRGLAHGFTRAVDRMKERVGLRLSALRSIHQMLDEYLPESAEIEETDLVRGHRNRALVVPELFRQAGFDDVRTDWHGFAPRIDTAEEFWELQTTFSSTARKRIPASSEDRVQALKDSFFRRCRAVQDRGGELVYNYAGLFVVGRRR